MKPKKFAGQGLVEYALILALIAVFVILTLRLLGVSVSNVFCTVTGVFSKNGCSAALCQDDFSSLSGSQNLSGTWTASNGQVCNANGGVIWNKCSVSSLNAADYSATINGANLTQGSGYGIFFRATNSAAGINGYAFQYDPGASGFVIRKWVNGAEIFNPTLARTAVPAGFNWYGTHNLSVQVVGSTITGYLDGQAVVSVQDSTFTSGGTAVRTWDSTNLCMDSFSINPPK